jgi:hypothetical protein
MSQEFGWNQGDDYMLDILINSADNRTELEKKLDFIAKELKDKFQQDKLQEVLDNAIDIILYVSLPNKELVGFDIGISTGSPNIDLVYNRGVCQLRGSWGSASDRKDIDNEICETILDYLEELSATKRT